MKRRVVITIKVQEQADKYSWDDVSEVELVTSSELLNEITAAQAIVTAMTPLLKEPVATQALEKLADVPDEVLVP